VEGANGQYWLEMHFSAQAVPSATMAVAGLEHLPAHAVLQLTELSIFPQMVRLWHNRHQSETRQDPDLTNIRPTTEAWP